MPVFILQNKTLSKVIGMRKLSISKAGLDSSALPRASTLRAELWTLTIFFILAPFLCVLLPADAASAEETEIYDPIEPFNRGVFWFNDTFDVYFLEPVARGYDYITPRTVQTGVSNFFDNLKYPAYLVSDLLQLKFDQAGTHTARFFLNSTFGVLGLVDAAENLGFEKHHEDFGTMLGYNGVGPGPYIVLPFLGPSNLRDAVGTGVDALLNPVYHLGAYGVDDNDAVLISAGATALNVVNTRARLLDAVSSAKDASLDYYLFVRKAYSQIRYEQIYDEAAPESEEFDDEFAEFEDEFEEEVDAAVNQSAE
jgi:phospholipid-binding lipoprotein MlaA